MAPQSPEGGGREGGKAGVSGTEGRRLATMGRAGTCGDHFSAAELAPLLAPLQIKVIAITRKGLELSVAPAANAIASEWVGLVCGAVGAATLGVDLPGVAPDPVGARILAGGQDGVEVGLLARDAGFHRKLGPIPSHPLALGHACAGALAATAGLELPDDPLRFVIQIGEGEDEAALSWKRVIRSWPRDRRSVYNAQTALGGPGIFFVVSSGGWGREEGRRDRGDGDRLPQRHRGRSWSTRVLSVLALASSLDQPPSPPSRRCCRMPMSCLVTEGDFSEHFPKRFRHAFLVLTRYFFHFFFFCQEPRSQVLLPRRRRGRPDGNRCCPSARRRGRGYAPCCPRERHPARRATVSAQFHSST